MSTFSILSDHLQPSGYFAAHRVFTVATHHFIQIKIWKCEILISLVISTSETPYLQGFQQLQFPKFSISLHNLHKTRLIAHFCNLSTLIINRYCKFVHILYILLLKFTDHDFVGSALCAYLNRIPKLGFLLSFW